MTSVFQSENFIEIHPRLVKLLFRICVVLKRSGTRGSGMESIGKRGNPVPKKCRPSQSTLLKGTENKHAKVYIEVSETEKVSQSVKRSC